IEAVLSALRDQTPATMRRRKATVIRPEVFLHYGEQLRVGLHLPERHSDRLAELARSFFDAQGFWKEGDRYDSFIEAIDTVPEQVTVLSDAMEFMERAIEHRDMAEREGELVQQLEQGRLRLDVLKVPLYPYQVRGALFAAYRGRCILGD